MPKAVVAKRPRGRPPKVTSERKGPAKPITIEYDKDLNKLPKIYKCLKCGKMTLSAPSRFYKSGFVNGFKGNDGYTSYCKDCCESLFDEYKAEYGNEKLALYLTCLHTGHHFNEILYEIMAGKGESIKLGVYLRQLNQSQYSGKTLVDNILELYDKQRLFLSSEDIQNHLEGSWKPQDRKNMMSCIRMIGYDPFDDPSYTNNDRKFLFNALSSYLIDESVLEDSHKVQCIINIVKMLWQISVIQSKVSSMLKATTPEMSLSKTYIESMTKLQYTVNAIAKANGISQEGANGKTTNKTFTGVIKDIADAEVLEAKNNYTTAKLDEAYRHIAHISHKALIDELNFTSDEYAKMVGEQSETIVRQQDTIIALKEEIRLAKVELEVLKNPKAYKRIPFENYEIIMEGTMDIEDSVDTEDSVEGGLDEDGLVSDNAEDI